jgi:transcription elongation GreA/GreB family factor
MRAIDGEVFAAFDVQRMSRAFVRESDEAAESLPERVVSSHPNFVTTTGLRQIEEQVANLETARQTARGAADKALLARIERDLRYWTQRLATARVIEFAPASANVRFGTRVTVRFEDGAERTFQLVGEDEANPAQGLLSWVAPLAAAVVGQAAGDTLDFQGRPVEIVSVDSDCRKQGG